MQRWPVIASLAFGVVLALCAVLARVKFGGRVELKTLDLVLLVLPLLLVLLVMGKLKRLDAFGVKADFSELFADAARTRIAAEVAYSWLWMWRCIFALKRSVPIGILPNGSTKFPPARRSD